MSFQAKPRGKKLYVIVFVINAGIKVNDYSNTSKLIFSSDISKIDPIKLSCEIYFRIEFVAIVSHTNTSTR